MEIDVKRDSEITTIKIEGLRTLCPHRRQNKEDYTNLEINYVPGYYEVDKAALERFIKTEIENREMAMELIPIKILWFLIESTAMRKPGRKDAAPEMIHISSTSSGKIKKWKMSINLKVNRKIV